MCVYVGMGVDGFMDMEKTRGRNGLAVDLNYEFQRKEKRERMKNMRGDTSNHIHEGVPPPRRRTREEHEGDRFPPGVHEGRHE